MATTFREAFRAERQVAVNGHDVQRTPVLVAAGSFIGKHSPHWSAIRTSVMSFIGFLLISLALASVSVALGIGSFGVFILVMEALRSEAGSQPERSRARDRR